MILGKIHKFNRDQIKTLLNDFNRESDEDFNKNIPYHFWRALKRSEEIYIFEEIPDYFKEFSETSKEEPSKFRIYTPYYSSPLIDIAFKGLRPKGFGDFLFFYVDSYCGENSTTIFSIDQYELEVKDFEKIKELFATFEENDDLVIPLNKKEIKDQEVLLNTNLNSKNISFCLDDSIKSINTTCNSVKERLTSVEDKLKKKDNNKKEKSEFMKGFNFNFGPCTNDDIRMSMYGLAIKNSEGTWVSYNSLSGEIVDVDVLNFDGRRYMYKMPVAMKDVRVGDMVIHNRVPMFVINTKVESKEIMAIDVRMGEKKIIIPTTNMFGFDFMTKVVSFMDGFCKATPSSENPFGNMLPLLMMNNSDTGDEDFPLIAYLMTQNQNSLQLMQNPMLMYFLLKDKGSEKKPSDLMSYMFVMNAFQNSAVSNNLLEAPKNTPTSSDENENSIEIERDLTDSENKEK